jgi:Flp pilus assembly protein TadG
MAATLRYVRMRSEAGQSAVEFVLVLPIALLLILGMFQLGVLVRDQMLVLGAAREGAREATVTPDAASISSAAAAAAPGLKLEVSVTRGTKRGDPARVDVSASPVRLPLVGRIVGGITLKGAATMRLERSD